MDMLKIAYEIGFQAALKEEFEKEAVNWEAMFPTFRRWLGIAPELGHRVMKPGVAKSLIARTTGASAPGRSFLARAPQTPGIKMPTPADIAAANARARFQAMRGGATA